MSEYQFIAFRAVDRPLSDRDLVYAQQQSSRAEINRWYFENEYHFGDFRGSVNGLLRRGYDVHLHYANFGIRKIALRLPVGLPFPRSFSAKCLNDESLNWTKDPRGKGGILTLNSLYEPDDLDELYSPREYLDDVVEIRNGLLTGDARVLYLIWLCATAGQNASPDTIEPPVPAGLGERVESHMAVMEFFGLDPLILRAASVDAPTPSNNREDALVTWLDSIGEDAAKQLLREFLANDPVHVKAETLSMIRRISPSVDWPTVVRGRSLEELLEITETLRLENEARAQNERETVAQREAEKQARDRRERLEQMVHEPQKWLRKADKLVNSRGTRNYKAATEILFDLREAIGGEEGVELTRRHAAHLAKKHRTLNHLKSLLRKRGLLE